MSLLDGAPKSPLPSMSWDSVVDGDESAAPQPTPTPPVPARPAPPAPSEASGMSDELAAASPVALTFESEAVTADPTGPLTLGVDVSAAAPVTQPPAPTPTPTPPAPASGSLFSPVNIAVPAAPPAPPARLVEPEPVPEPVSKPEPAAHVEPAAASAPTAEPDVPAIVEATPIPELTSEQQSAVEASNTNEMAVTAAEPTAAAPAPAVPSAQSNALNLPSQQAAPAARAAAVSPLAVDMSAQPSSKPRRQKRSGSGFGLIFVLLVLVGLVAAGIVFGKPYLFPDEWDSSAKSYAENIEEIRGVEFVEPLTVISEPTDAYRARVGDQLLADWESQMPMWRSLGLAAGGTERDVLDSLIAERSPAIYSSLDGQVYHDAAVPAVDLDAQVTLAMATAALDQEFLFAPRSGSRTLLAEAMTQAHVQQQATSIQQRSDAPTAIRPNDDAPLAFLPPVLDYQLVAPTVFAELLPEFDDVAVNPLADIGPAGPGPLNSAVFAETDAPGTLPEESVVGTPQQLGRSFWYLSFASHLDGAEAWRMSAALSAATTTEVNAGGTTCFYSLFNTATVDGVSLISNGLTSWTAAAAPEMQASVSTIDGTTVQLRTCDPGDVFTSNARFGVARDLIAWQAAELATITGVVNAGGDQAAIDQAAIDQAVNRLAVSGATDRVLALDPTASATEVATAARNAVVDVVAVPAQPAAEPTES